MPSNVVHFAVHADDVERARAFYEGAFGWRFTPFGPPDFYRVHTGTPEQPGIFGALQKREEPLEGRALRGYECTISVADLDAARDAVVRHGGRITFPEHQIPGVGRLFQFEDTEGNRVCAMQYEPEKLGELKPRGSPDARRPPRDPQPS